MVDWSIARQVARFAGGNGGPAGQPDEVRALVEEHRGAVAGYTQLRPRSAIPPAEVVTRADWAAANLTTLAELLDPVAARLEQRLSAAGPLAGALRMGAGATLAAEVGLVMGYASQRVLGQYELSLLQPEAPARLLFVTPNVEAAVESLHVDRESFFGWLVIHELTHVFQFESVPWLRDHLGGLLRSYLATLEVRIERGSAGGLPTIGSVSRLVESLREGGLAALVQTGEQRGIMDRVQAVMAVIEGYSEHVMDAVGAEVLPAYAGLREAMMRRRASRSAPERILQRLLGFDVKLRQYELGKAFSDAVVEGAGLEALNRVWEAPELMPTLRELERPGEWLRRAEAAPAAA